MSSLSWYICMPDILERSRAAWELRDAVWNNPIKGISQDVVHHKHQIILHIVDETKVTIKQSISLILSWLTLKIRAQADCFKFLMGAAFWEYKFLVYTMNVLVLTDSGWKFFFFCLLLSTLQYVITTNPELQKIDDWTFT